MNLKNNNDLSQLMNVINDNIINLAKIITLFDTIDLALIKELAWQLNLLLKLSCEDDPLKDYLNY